MKRTLLLVLCLALAISCTMGSRDALTGTWKITAKGVGRENNPCPFGPEEITFFRDGTVSMSNLPPGMKMFFKTALTSEEARAIMEKFPYLRDKDHILLMKPSSPTDWINSMAYDYTLTGDQLTPFAPGWTASVFGPWKRWKRIKEASLPWGCAPARMVCALAWISIIPAH